MRVLHLTLSLEPGGRREAIRTLAARHHGTAVASHVGCLDSFGCEPEVIEQEFAGHVELSRSGVADLSAFRRLLAYCREHQVDLVHTHDAASQLYAALVRLARPRTKVIMTFHRSLGFETARRRDRLRNALAGLACDAIVVGSVERRQHYLAENHVRASKVVRIPFGIDTSRFHPDRNARASLRAELGCDDSTLLIGAVGHFGEEKGIDLVIRSFQQLIRLEPQLNVRLVVVGSGPDSQRQQMEQLARDMDRPDLISLVGFQRDVPRWFNAMDIFVHAPRQEAFGLVVAEAMATGLPVIATRTGGVPDMVRHEKTGLLVPPEQPEQLADALRRLVQDEILRASLARTAYEVARAEYPAELYAQRYLALYRHLVGGRRVQSFDPFAIQCETIKTMGAAPDNASELSPSAD